MRSRDGVAGIPEAAISNLHIPAEVAEELRALSHRPAKDAIQRALEEQWLLVAIPLESSEISIPLDKGEKAAISLAMEMTADAILVDERPGRAAARMLGLRTAGVLGELLHAKLAGWLPMLRPEIARLRLEARFFIDAEIESFILSKAGE
jgi:predicted nucleic acid-binding protein